MNRTFLVFSSVCFLLLLFLLPFPSSVCACGMALSIDPYTHQFDYAKESDHQVFIKGLAQIRTI